MILQFLHVVWPIFAIAGLGWLWQRLGQPFDEKSVSALVTYLGVPSLLLSSLSRTSVRLDVLLQTLLAGGLALLLCAVGGAAVLKLARLPVRALPAIAHSPQYRQPGPADRLLRAGRAGDALCHRLLDPGPGQPFHRRDLARFGAVVD
jgi:malate permease and related proteins